jgi:beta-glucosidase
VAHHGDDRVEALLGQLTAAEKAALTGGDDTWHLPAIERLGIGRLKMSDGPSGVRGAAIGTRRSLSFPCGTAVGATWDVDLVARYGDALAAEARSKGVHLLLGPTVGIPRTPLGGRTFESFSEDPLLAAELAVAYVAAVQAGGVGCCVKHFACNDQEHERMSISAEVGDRALREIHLAPFEAAVVRAGAWAVMSAYNRLHGTYCGEHPWLLGELLKGEWGFDGVVVSDWFGTHSTVAAAIAGLDVEMPGPPSFLGPKLLAAVEAGDVAAEVFDDHARRVLRLAERTGLLDGHAGDSEAEEDDPARRALAREMAAAGIVLLANDGTLPIDAGAMAGRVAVVGPNGDLLATGGGGSSQVLAHRHLSLADELQARLAGTEVTYHVGCRPGTDPPPIDPRTIAPGLRLEVLAGDEVVAEEELSVGYFINFRSPVPGRRLRDLAFRATGTLRVPTSGRWRLGVANAGAARMFLDGAPIVENVAPNGRDFFFGVGYGTEAATVELEADRAHQVLVELTPEPGVPMIGLRLHAAAPVPDDPLADAVAAAAAADVAIVVVGASAETETEGFDRSSLALAGDQDELVRRVAAANDRTVVLVNAGAPVLLPWADEVSAVAVAWYPGEEGAAALADVLTGASEPTGRLPITFPRQLEDTPVHGEQSYPGSGGRVVYAEGVEVGYRHYDTNGVEPAFCFGHGVGYTTFDYGEVTAEAASGPGGGVTVSVPVTNTGQRRGTEVVQVYVRDLRSSVARPHQELGGFAKVAVEPGATETVVLRLDERRFSYWDEDDGAWRLEPGDFELAVGSSSRAIRRTTTIGVNGTGSAAQGTADGSA